MMYNPKFSSKFMAMLILACFLFLCGCAYMWFAKFANTYQAETDRETAQYEAEHKETEKNAPHETPQPKPVERNDHTNKNGKSLPK